MIADLKFFGELLSYKEALDDAMDQIMYSMALERKDEQTEIPVAQVIAELDLDVHRIAQLSEVVEDQ